ncbi:hypothetical protein RIF29_34305 [Crotalaria pallida]|uniref:Reverse transcriptase zinc-binding domain-containing protein n=1 Tax=Crotalaria pallida TaxID=3830 RepID=A0AAN9EEJ8_CROPI
MLLAKDFSGASSSLVSHNFDLWYKIWKAPCLPRCNDLVWQACRDIIPARTRLCYRGTLSDLICPLCGSDDETTTYALLPCPKVIPIWFVSPMVVCISPSNTVSFATWLHSTFLMSDNFDAGHVFELIQAIWDHRND